MKITVFEQNGSGRQKIAGISRYGTGITINAIISIDEFLPDFVDDPERYVPDDFSADLVLDYLPHPDLSHYLVGLCREKKIPVISSGKKNENALTPFTCCGLGRHRGLGVRGAVRFSRVPGGVGPGPDHGSGGGAGRALRRHLGGAAPGHGRGRCGGHEPFAPRGAVPVHGQSRPV
jgi:hypothetical protein